MDHLVNVGPGGTFRRSGTVQTLPADIDRIAASIAAHDPKKVVVHFHGGLVSESKGVELATRIAPVYEAGGAYPITVVWETGLLETARAELEKINATKLFNKLVNHAIKEVAKRLGAGVGAKGAGAPMTLEEVRLARATDEDIVELDARAKGGAEVLSEADLAAMEGEIELEVQAELEADPELESLFDDDALDPKTLDPAVRQELGAEGAKGVLSTIALARRIVKITVAVIRRYLNKRDHGVIPTVVEETLREVYVAGLIERLWGGMKGAAEAMWQPNDGAITEDGHAGSYLLAKLTELQEQNPGMTIDLVGHSAGSIAICHMLETASTRHPEFHVRNLVLLAPAATTAMFERGIVQHEKAFDSFRMFTMEDSVECQDSLVPGVYPRSLLYLVSGILEGEPDTPLCGLERHWPGTIVETWLRANGNDRLVTSLSKDDALDGFRTRSEKHGDFDNDPETLASLTAIVGS
jgi:hypothetical protein